MRNEYGDVGEQVSGIKHELSILVKDQDHILPQLRHIGDREGG